MSEISGIKKKLLEFIKCNDSVNLEKKSKESLDKYPNDIDLIQYYAIGLLQNNKKKESIEIFKLAIKKKKELIAPYLNIAKIYESLNDFERAEIYYNKAIDISHRKNSILLDASQFYKKIDRNKCEQVLVEAVRKEPDNLNALILIGDFYYEIKDYFSCINFLLKADQINKKIFQVKFLLGFCFLEIGNTIQSKKYFNECLLLNKNSIEVYQNLIYLNYIHGNKESANQLIHEAFKLEDLNPKVVEIYVMLNKLNQNSDFVKKLKNSYNLETNIQSKIIYGFALAKISDENNNLFDFKKYLDESNYAKRKIFVKYDFKSHLKQFDYLCNFFNIEYFKKFYSDKLDNELLMTPIFIVGMPRSGSTLIEQIISSHSKVLSLGEVDYFSESVNEIVKSENVEDFCNKFDSSEKTSLFKEIAKSYIKKVNRINSDKKFFFTDKMLLNFKLLPLIKLCFPNAKIIHCYRDPRDNCFSIYKTNFQSSFIPWAYDKLELVTFYNKYQETLMRYNNTLKDKIYNLRYEDLVTNSKEQIKNLLNFSNLEPEENCYNFFLNKREVKTASALQVRDKIYQSSIKKWKKYENIFPDLFINFNSNLHFLN